MTAARGRGVGQGRAKQRNRSPNVGRVRALPTVLSAFALPAEETSSRVKVSDVANGPRIATIIRAPIQLVRKESRESSLIKKNMFGSHVCFNSWRPWPIWRHRLYRRLERADDNSTS